MDDPGKDKLIEKTYIFFEATIMDFGDKFDDHFLEQDEEKEKKIHVETEQEREEREIEESTISRRHNTLKITLLTAIALIVLGLMIWSWLHFYRPQTQSVEKGWVMSVTNEGTLFKTIECKMITEDLILDSVKVQFNDDTVRVDGCDFHASITGDSLAREAVKWKATGKRVVATYDEYGGRLPWRGASRRVLTDIRPDTIEVDSL